MLMGKSRGKLGEPHENPLGTHWEHTRKQKQKQKIACHLHANMQILSSSLTQFLKTIQGINLNYFIGHNFK